MKKTKLYSTILTFSLFLFPSPVLAKIIEVDVPDNIYTISGIDNDHVLSIADNSEKDGGNIQLDKNISSPYQQFLILKEANGWYTIRNVASQLNLDVTNGISSPNTNLQQWTPNDSDAQLFKFYSSTTSDSVYIKSKLGTVLETCSDSNIQLQSFNNSTSEKYTLNLVPAELPSATLKTGYYTISSASDPSFTIGIRNDSKISGTDAIVNTHANSNSKVFKITEESNGWYSIQNKYSKLYLDIDSSNSLHQCIGNGSNSQKFRFYNAADGTFVIQSKYGQVLSAPDKTADSNTLIYLDLFSNTNTEKWIIKFIHFK